MEPNEFDALFNTVIEQGEKQKQKDSWLLINNENYVCALKKDNLMSIGCHSLGLTIVKDTGRNILKFVGDESKAPELVNVIKSI